MIPAAFDYQTPGTVAEALTLLSQNPDAKLLSGGHSLIPLMRLRLARPSLVIDLRKISALSEITAKDGVLRLGAGVTHDAVHRSASIEELLPLLAATAGRVGDIQVRNVGTVGGSVVHADPSSDWPASLLAAEAHFVLESTRGTRRVLATDFFLGPMESAAKPDEILTAIEVPIPEPGHRAQYSKMAQDASGFALAGVAIMAKLDERGRVAWSRIGITGVASVPYRALKAEGALLGQLLDESKAKDAASLVADGVVGLDDLHATGAYRLQLATVLTRRSLIGLAGSTT